MQRVLQVNQVKLSYLKSSPPKLMIEATGIGGTPCWKNIELVPLEKKLSADGILDLEFVGNPPKDIIPQVTQEVTTDILIENEVDKIIGVLIHSRTNKFLELIGGQEGEPVLEKAMMGRDFVEGRFDTLTTLAIGEEDRFPPKTFIKGEEGKTLIDFEEGKTLLYNEEGKSPWIGEEGKSPWTGEEGKSPWTGEEGKTLQGAEEGKSPVFGEETFASLHGESGPIGGLETNPGIEDKTGTFGEDSVVGEDFKDIFADRIRTPFNRR